MWNLHKIPKICHMYWGSSTLPFMRYASIISFKKYNPDWQLKVYIPNKVYEDISWVTSEQKGVDKNVLNYFMDLIAFPGIEIIKLKENQYGIPDNIPEVFKSDILRIHLMAEQGGLWSDSDIVYFKSMNYLDWNQPNFAEMDCAVCIHDTKHKIGFYLSCQDNAFFNYTRKEILDYLNFDNYQSLGVSYLNERYKSIFDISCKFNIKVANISEITVYPYLCTNIIRAYHTSELQQWYNTQNCIGIHWFGGDYNSIRLINNITKNNMYLYSHTIGQAIQDVFK